MFFADACADYLAHIRHERGLSPRTCANYRDWLSTYRHWCDDQSAGAAIADRFNATILRKYLYGMSQRGLRPRSIRSAFAPLKSIGVYLVQTGAIVESPLDHIQMPKRDAAYRPVVSAEEVAALLEAADRLRNPRRRAMARAMILILSMCGLRFQEMLDLKLEDVRLDLKTLTVRQGKGSKARTLYPAPPVLEALAEWTHERRRVGSHGRICEHDWLWAHNATRRMGELGTRDSVCCTGGIRVFGSPRR